ncbi:MAG TPA: lipopolysaccharide heptosyltransferase II [Syntrophales bacterium]|nr:lipopolysaccharide heptosyltransferase II [Syntrophobacterales bacterium]HQL90883.1 lipopolysaccharide heptosyltransferase II [Syntrophales bacterium]
MTARQRIKDFYLRSRGIALRAMPTSRGRGPAGDVAGDAIRRVLLIRLDRVGDVVLSTPAIEVLKKRFPRAELTVLVRPQTAPLLEHNPHVDRCVVLDPGASPSERVRILKGLRRRRFDLAVDPCADWKLASALIAWVSGARVRIGYPCGGREAFFTTAAELPDGNAHMTGVILRTLKPLGIDGLTPQPRVYLSPEERDRAAGWLAGQRRSAKPLVGIHPGAHYETQRWPAEHYAALAERLRARCDVILFGGPADAGLVERIRSGIPGGVLTVVTPDIRRFAALLSCCRLLVCNNSGPLHVAAALGVETVSFMGPTVKALWSPLGEGHVVLRMDGLPCIGCNRGLCPVGTLECMRRITPDMAAEAVLRFA